MKRMISSSKWYCCVMMLVVGSMLMGGGGAQTTTLAQECSQKLPEVMTCTAFASGKESAPEHKCCESVKEMKESNPACLCFLIQQIHNGTNPALQKMNIQEARLLLLPSACNIANASISDCPKYLTCSNQFTIVYLSNHLASNQLLKLPPNSPDAAIFNNVTSTVSPTGGTSSASTTPSSAFKHEATTLSRSIAVSALFFVVFLTSGFGV